MKIIHGTPLYPKEKFLKLAGGSFCVSFHRPDQLQDCRSLVGHDQVLLLDNGAFSHWRSTGGHIDPLAYWEWANHARFCCPQAIAVIPDRIGGTLAENRREITRAFDRGTVAWPARSMPVWHFDEPLNHLRWMCRHFHYVALGSCAQYDVQRHRRAYLQRLDEARRVICSSPREVRTHLMRGLGVAHEPEAAFAWSADSTNVTRNHHRHKRQHGSKCALHLAQRVEAKINGRQLPLPMLRSASNAHFRHTF